MNSSNEAMIEHLAGAINSDLSEDEAANGVQKYLSFMLDREIFAFNIMGIKEIIEYGNINRIPMVPDYIRGVTNLRGSVVPVIDLSVRLGKLRLPVTKKTCIIIVEVKSGDETVDVGVVIDSIYEVSGFREADIEPAPSFGAGIPAEYIEGMGKRGDNFVVLLNASRVLSIDELSALIGEMAPAKQSGRRLDAGSRENTHKGNGAAGASVEE